MSVTIMREGLCQSMRNVADHCGMDVAQELVRVFGGCRIWVPLKWRPDHYLNRIGETHAQALVGTFGNTSLDIPRQLLTVAGRAQVIDRLTREGLTQMEIARMLGCSQRAISRHQRGHLTNMPPTMKRRGRMADPRQIDLEDLLK